MKSKNIILRKTVLAFIAILGVLFLSRGNCFSEALREQQNPAHHVDAVGENASSSSHSKEGVTVEQKGSKIILANQYVGIEFVKTKDVLILSDLYDIGKSQEYISSDPKNRSSVWELTFRKDSGKNKKEFIISGFEKAITSFSVIQTSKDKATLVLNWQGLNVGEEDNKIDVRAAVSLKADGPFSFWRINIMNRSKIWGLWCVYFPVMKLVPIGESSEDNFLAIGRSRGMLVKDPFHSNSRNAFGIAAQKGASWPGVLNMQFQALYNINGKGIYLAAHDGDGYKKNFYFSPDPKSEIMEYKIGHFPSNMGFSGEDYHMSYDVVMGPFKGDWYDGAQIYRTWALKQPWCRKGKLKIRKDIPIWFKEAPIMLKVTSNKGEKDLVELKNRTIGFLNFIGSDLPVNWYTWKKLMPEHTAYNNSNSPYRVPDRQPYPVTNIHDGNFPEFPALTGFSSVCAEIAKARGHVLPYVCARIYDQGIDENAPFAKEAKPNTMKDVNGEIKYIEKGPAWTMCYHTQWWQNRLKDTVVALIRKEHAQGIYFDTMYGGFVQCFDTKHGHSHGGGNDPYLGAKKLSYQVREDMKSNNREAIMTGESPAETAIDFLDGFLYRWNTWPDMIPLFATVYGDFIPRYGLDLEPKSDGFFIQSAVLFVEGAMMGRLSLHGDDLLKDFDKGSAYTEKMKFLKKLSMYRRPAIGGSYLIYGQLLRSLRLIKIEPDQSVSYNEPGQRYKNGLINVKSLQTGVFKATDGSLGIFAVNVSDVPITFRFDLSSDNYPLLQKGINEVVRVDENGTKHPEGNFKAGNISIKKEIAGHDVMMLCIRAKKI